ncbi:MAG: response regulator [bacterium]|nr:response regulator [bacterium]
MHTTTKEFRILIVDDIVQNIQIVASILRQNGYQMAFASNGQAALTHTESIKFDLILLDIMMPEMDGYEVCKRLKAEPATQEIPVIFLTAKTETDAIVKGFESGAVDYVTKPFNAAELLARVKTHLELKCAREEIEEQNRELLEAAKLHADVERITRHDLKVPLTAIIGFPEIIRMYGNLNEKQVDCLRKIKDSGCRMLNMINLSLDLFKIEKGLYQLQPVPVNIVHVIDNLTAEIELLLQSGSLTLKVVLDDKLVGDGDTFTILGEELLCYSMLANLLKNALEASPKDGCVTVSLDGNAEMAIIRIHNQGAVHEQIQDKFFEKYITSGKEMEGTGLGTYSAKLIAEIQTGSISMTTSEREGTIVTIRLPKAIEHENESSLQHILPHSEHASFIPLPKEELATLHDLAKIGDIMGIRKNLTRLDTLDSQYAPFVAQLRRLADSLQVRSILELVERYITPEC